MTEYWQSQARKYCDFCKCWFADNKVSISFHENGKRHKENVQKHISTLSKKSTKEAKQQSKIDDEMKKMEAAAMAAYLKDVQNNADLTSQSINEKLAQSGSSICDVTVGEPSASTASTASTAVTAKSDPVWHEVKNEGDDAGSYYWNTVTNETTWDPPDEFLSLAQQEEKKLKTKSAEKKKQKIKQEKQKEAVKEAKAYVAREQMRELAVKKDPPPKFETFGPAPRATKPYGSWTEVVNEPAPTIDLQLPKTKELPPPPVVMEPEKIVFKEKRVESLGEGPVEFKKRKFNANRRNARQKVDDD